MKKERNLEGTSNNTWNNHTNKMQEFMYKIIKIY